MGRKRHTADLHRRDLRASLSIDTSVIVPGSAFMGLNIGDLLGGQT